MIYGSICSGIEAATVAWSPLGWRPAFFSETNTFCRDLLVEHYPRVECYFDFTRIPDEEIREWPTLDILIAGTPCQSFSVAGRRAGLDDPRGLLAFEFLRLLRRTRHARKGPRWFVFENVPGLLSSKGGRDFSDWIRATVQCGYYCAWRVLDCQYWGLAQRRKRLFVVGYLGDWRPSAAVLFESQSVPGNLEEGGEEREEVAKTLRGQSNASHWDDSDTYIPILEATKRQGTRNSSRDGLGIGNPGDPMFSLQSSGQHAVAFNWQSGGSKARLGYGQLPNLQSNQTPAVAYGCNRTSGALDKAGSINAKGGSGRMDFETETFVVGVDNTNHKLTGNKIGTLDASLDRHNRGPALLGQLGVRRLTPLECERLQGFPDNYTLIEFNGKPATDSPRYKAIGNSFPVPVVRWIGQRIEAVDKIIRGRRK